MIDNRLIKRLYFACILVLTDVFIIILRNGQGYVLWAGLRDDAIVCCYVDRK